MDLILTDQILSTIGELTDKDTENIKITNKIDFTNTINTATILFSIIGLLVVITVWCFSSITNTFLASIIVGFSVYLIRQSYIERLQRLTCPNCGEFDNTKTLFREEKSKMLLPSDLNGKIVVSYKYHCDDCKHNWYTSEYENDPMHSSG